MDGLTRTCDCVDAWRLQTPPHGSIRGAPSAGPMICEVCGLVVKAEGSPSPRIPLLGSPSHSSGGTLHENDDFLLSSSLSDEENNTPRRPETPLTLMRGETPMFFPSSPPSTEIVPTFLALQESRASSSRRSSFDLDQSQSDVSITSKQVHFPPSLIKAGSESINSISTMKSKTLNNDKYSTPWSKMREEDNSMSLSLGMCLPKKGSSKVRRSHGPSTSPTKPKRHDKLSTRTQTTIAQHMARFEKERIPNDKESLVSSHCSKEIHPGLFVLGHTKPQKRPYTTNTKSVRPPIPVNKAPSVNEPFSMSSSKLMSPLAVPFVLESEARARSMPISGPSVQRVSYDQTLRDGQERHNYWAIEFGAQEKLRAATAATCRRRIGRKLSNPQTDYTMDGNGSLGRTITTGVSSYTSMTTTSSSSSFRTKAHEARSSGYADFSKQFARSSLLWPTADPDGARRPTTTQNTRR